MPLVSICIPSYQRPDLLLETVWSCLAQTYKDIEIVISDDSPDDASERAIAQLNQPEKIRYYRNSPALKQAGNVNQLFDLAKGKYLILMHDDDLLLPDAVSDLLKVWEENPDIVACFGKQYIINMKSEILEEESINLNRDYYRSPEYAGLQHVTLVSALRGQFPNNGYMILTQVAREVRYSDSPWVGDICDYDFGLRLAGQAKKLYFLDKYVSANRLTDIAVSVNNNHSNLTYDLVSNLVIPEEQEYVRKIRLSQYAAPAINKWLRLGIKHRALDIYFSEYYSWKRRLSKLGVIQALLFLVPNPFLKVVLEIGRV